jgi:hypothetical protein
MNLKDLTKGVLLVALAVLLVLSQFYQIKDSTGSGTSTSIAEWISYTLPILLIVASIHWVALQLFIFN